MRIQVWHSFASNNSASFYVVARFKSTHEATQHASNLRGYFERNDRELAEMTRRERRANRELTLANLELSEAIGFEWPTQITQGFADDVELRIESVGETIAVYHDYCLGFAPELGRYLERAGAVMTGERVDKHPLLSLIVWRTGDGSDTGLLDELGVRFRLDGHLPVQSFYMSDSQGASFRTRRAAGFVGAISMFELGGLLDTVREAPFSDFHAALDRTDDVSRFDAVTKGCVACGGDDLGLLVNSEGDQGGAARVLTCHDCGGMFDLDAAL